MASLLFAPSLPLFRRGPDFLPIYYESTYLQTYNLKLYKYSIRSVSRIRVSQSDKNDSSDVKSIGAGKRTRKPRQPSKRSKKQTVMSENEETTLSSYDEEENNLNAALTDDSKKVKRRGRKKASSSEPVTEKVTRRKTRKKSDNLEAETIDDKLKSSEDFPSMSTLEPVKELSSSEDFSSLSTLEPVKELLVTEDDTEDVSFPYEWPPLVCCYGSAQHAFVPSGRPANRLIDHEIHETMKDMLWSPTKFIRAPGSSPSSVAVALASLGGRVAFMGKLGDDEYGQCLLYHLNINNVQTRAIKVDNTKPTAVSHMKISRRGGLKLTPVRPCAEDSLLSTDINIDVLKESKMFYFNSSSLLEPNMRTTTIQTIKTFQKFGGVVFFDLNLPLSLWQSRDETIMFIQQAWSYADIIEVTKQELEFICGIEPTENFDIKDNGRSKFVHYKPELIMPLWHENLKVLFVTNGTSKIHFYTEKENGFVHGMEDAPITPFTADLSVAGDAIVAALMRMLIEQPDLITDKGYLEHMIKYAINCGVIDQWLVARVRGYPPKEGMDGVRSISEREYRTVGVDDED